MTNDFNQQGQYGSQKPESQHDQQQQSTQPYAVGQQDAYGQHARQQTQPFAAQGQSAQQQYGQAQWGQQYVAQEPKGGSSSKGGAKTFLTAFAGAAVACVLAFGIAFGTGALGATTTIGATTSTTITAEDTDATLAEQVASKALPSVVSITTYVQQGSLSSMYGMYGYGSGSSGSSSELVEYSLGSGVVLTEDGYIITNHHVVDGATAFEVTVEGEVYEAELVGYDATSDIAVLKCQGASGLTPIEIGDSDSITVGEWVMTIGSPYGLEQSVASGIVSATNRSSIVDSSSDGTSRVYTNLIQTDAAINSGNSGGALVDADGKLIGINTLITSTSGDFSGIGFAIPVNYAVGLAEQIIAGETPTHAQLGVSMTSVTSQNAKLYGLSTDSGAYVSSVESGSGAESAGIKVGDIITAFDGTKIESASDLMLAVRSHNPGDTVTIELNRDGEVIEVEVTLGENADETSTTQQQSSSYQDMLDQFLGNQGNSSQDAA